MKPHAITCKSYIDNHIKGRRIAKAVLLHGPPGTGKTTLVNVIANDYGLEIITPLLNDRKKFLEASQSNSLSGNGCLIFVECVEQYKTKHIVELIEQSQYPIILETTHYHDVSYDVVKLCLQVEVPSLSNMELSVAANAMGVSIDNATNYHELQNRGDPVADDDFHRRVVAYLRGQNDVYFTATECSDVVRWIADNTSVKKAADLDLLHARYRDVGAMMENYMFKDQFTVQNPQSPWSNKIFPRRKSKEQPVERRGSYF